MSLLVVIPFTQSDLQLALNLLDWIKELGGAKSHECLLVIDSKTETGDFALFEKANDVFKEADAIKTAFVLRDERWPVGPNWMFETALRHLSGERAQPFLWLEPDCVPMREGWLEDIDAAYRASTKPFMGQIVEPNEAGLPEKMLSGVAVYPSDAAKVLLPRVVQQKVRRAFDVATADLVVPLAQHTRLIWNFYGDRELAPTFVRARGPGQPKNAMTVAEIPPQTALFHRCKDRSLIKLLRAYRAESCVEVTC